jgi:hypothetical protein
LDFLDQLKGSALTEAQATGLALEAQRWARQSAKPRTTSATQSEGTPRPTAPAAG